VSYPCFQLAAGLPCEFREAQMCIGSVEELWQPLVQLQTVSIYSNSHCAIGNGSSNLPNIRSFTASVYSLHGDADFSFFETCTNLEVFRFRPATMETLSRHDCEQFSFLKHLVELDLYATYVSVEGMLALFNALPRSLRRFRHRRPTAIRLLSAIQDRFPDLQEFQITEFDVRIHSKVCLL
jgi:hypothetical protein